MDGFALAGEVASFLTAPMQQTCPKADGSYITCLPFGWIAPVYMPLAARQILAVAPEKDNAPSSIERRCCLKKRLQVLSLDPEKQRPASPLAKES